MLHDSVTYRENVGYQYLRNNPFSIALHRFLNQRHQTGLLPGYGWLDGGCLTLARGIQTWLLPSMGKLVAWESEKLPGVLDHAAIKIRGTEWVIDGDGLQSQEVFSLKMRLIERSPGRLASNPYIAESLAKKSIDNGDIVLNASVAAEITRRLRNKFGDPLPGFFAFETDCSADKVRRRPTKMVR